jgi:hypothetical protein
MKVLVPPFQIWNGGSTCYRENARYKRGHERILWIALIIRTAKVIVHSKACVELYRGDPGIIVVGSSPSISLPRRSPWHTTRCKPVLGSARSKWLEISM